MNQPIYDQPQSIYFELRLKLERTRVPLTKISADTGIPYYWLSKMKIGQVVNPGLNRCEYLMRYLDLHQDSPNT